MITALRWRYPFAKIMIISDDVHWRRLEDILRIKNQLTNTLSITQEIYRHQSKIGWIKEIDLDLEQKGAVEKVKKREVAVYCSANMVIAVTGN